MKIGIDFGTCFSSVAIMNGLIPVTTYVKDCTGQGIPSLFMYSKEQGKELYGDECNTADGFNHPNDVVRYMKRTIREDSENLKLPVMTGGREYTMSDIIEKYLTFLVDETRKGAMRSGEFKSNEIEEVTITAPVGIAQDSMMASEYNKLIRDAMCRITCLDESKVHVLQEPVAAAVSYLYGDEVHQHYEGDQTVLVFDLGGGTLDVTAVKHNPRTSEYTILAKEGDLQLGGNDWDAKLRDLVLSKTGIEYGGTDEEKADLCAKITKLKMELSSVEKSMTFFDMDGETGITALVTREEFEQCTVDLLERAIEVIDRTMDNIPLGEKVDKVILVGGSSNMPQIERAIKERFADIDDEAEVLLYDPSKAIAKGAAIYSKLKSSKGGSKSGGKVIDCSSCTYGFISHKDGCEEMIYNMIYKGMNFNENESIQMTADTSFVAMRDSQTQVSFEICESDVEEGFSNWYPLNSGTVNGLCCTVQVPPEYIGRATRFRMYPTLCLNSDGILEITVRDGAGNRLAYETSAKDFDEDD